MCVGILMGFDCLLRTGELLQLRIGDLMINDQMRSLPSISLIPRVRNAWHHVSYKQNSQAIASSCDFLKHFARAFDSWPMVFLSITYS